MSTLLWNKSGVQTSPSVMKFLAGEDVVLDRELLGFDIQASAAHAHGLALAGLLSEDDVESIIGALKELDERWRAGTFVLDDQYEDGHSAIESFLIDQLGEIGARVHLGRSRNDQVLVATRLYMIDALDRLVLLLVNCARASLERAREHEMDPMPGYTHLQRAVPSSVGLWMGSFAESFADSARLIKMTREWIDASPLGTAAGYGVNLPLARQQVSEALGFSRIIINPMAAQATRGKHEHQVIAAMWQAMQDVRRLAWDLSLYSTTEFGFVQMPPETITGSSIMPNKKNPDLAELLRASCAVVGGCIGEIQQLLSLPSGYHRDLQLTKPPLLRATRTTLDAIALVPDVIRNTVFNTQAMRDAIDPSMMATDRAVDLAGAGMPFREAYKAVGESLDELKSCDPASSLQARVSPGACADLRLDEIESRIDAVMHVSDRDDGQTAR